MRRTPSGPGHSASVVRVESVAAARFATPRVDSSTASANRASRYGAVSAPGGTNPRPKVANRFSSGSSEAANAMSSSRPNVDVVGQRLLGVVGRAAHAQPGQQASGDVTGILHPLGST